MEEAPVLSVFESIVVIQLSRIYDVQMAILSQMNDQMAINLADIHEQGRTVGPEPSKVLEDEPG